MSQAQLADAANTSQPQIDRLEKGTRKLTREWAERLAPPLGLTAQELMFSDENEAGAEGAAIAKVDGRLIRMNMTADSIPEIDTTLGAGGGGYPLPTTITDGERTYAAEAVRDEWVFPSRFVRDELRVNTQDVDIIPIRGDSMVDPSGGGLKDGDRAMVHRRDKLLRQGGIFAIRDDGETIVKQVEYIRGSDPPRIKCTSLNPRYTPFELVLDGSAEVIGRVILNITRM